MAACESITALQELVAVAGAGPTAAWGWRKGAPLPHGLGAAFLQLWGALPASDLFTQEFEEVVGCSG